MLFKPVDASINAYVRFILISASFSPERYLARVESGLGGETSSYIAARLANDNEHRKSIKKPRFFTHRTKVVQKKSTVSIKEVVDSYDNMEKVCSSRWLQLCGNVIFGVY